MNGNSNLGFLHPSTPEGSEKVSKITENRETIRSSRTSIARSEPLIPLTLLDAPSQRFYALALYIALFGWRLYDWGKLVEDGADSFWLFMKWVAIDAAFLYALPELRIPWLEWSSTIVTGLFLAHALLNGILMFRIPVSKLHPSLKHD
jgi:nucleoporin POM152